MGCKIQLYIFPVIVCFITYLQENKVYYKLIPEFFLAQLSGMLTGWTYSIAMVRRPSSSSSSIVHTFEL